MKGPANPWELVIKKDCFSPKKYKTAEVQRPRLLQTT